MKKLNHLLLAAMLLVSGAITTSCTDYQDEIDALDYRITVLEELVKQVNNNLDAMRAIVDAMEAGDYITDVRETTGGYVANFHKAGPLYIMDGVDGKDAQTPDISLQQDPADSQWYWVVNGEWLVINGEKICASGKDGKDGKEGKDAVSPQVRINPDTGIWEISADGGQTWVSTGTSATGRDGRDGRDGRNGQDGKDGKDGNQFFLTVSYTIDSDGTEYMVITTKGGQTFKIPVYNNK